MENKMYLKHYPVLDVHLLGRLSVVILIGTITATYDRVEECVQIVFYLPALCPGLLCLERLGDVQAAARSFRPGVELKNRRDSSAVRKNSSS